MTASRERSGTGPRLAFKVGLAASLGLMVAGAFAQDPQAPAMRASSRIGQGLFQANCSMCHADTPNPAGGERQPPPLSLLRQFTPEKIYAALTTGKMEPMAAKLSAVQRQQIAEWATGRPLGADDRAGDVANMPNRCPTNPALAIDPKAGDWRGWGPEPSGSRFQTAKAAGITAAQAPKLKVKWVFAVPNAIEMFSQPTVAAGRIFFSSDNSYLYSLDARTGCAYWSYKTESGVRTSPLFAEIPGKPGQYGVFFGDRTNTLYGLDAHTGKLLWKLKAEDHPRAQITGSEVIYKGRMYAGISVGGETIVGGSPTYPCCTARGSLVAVDIATGKQLWKTYTIVQTPTSRGKNTDGVELFGPAGASIWNTPTIDPKRKLIYVGTGNNYVLPATDTSDSIMAIDMETGKIVWHHQEFQNDAYIGGCGPTGAAGSNCPAKLGPDWDFGGASMQLKHLPNGKDLVVGAGKGGVAVAVDPDQQGKVVWRTPLFRDGETPSSNGLVVFGGASDNDNLYYPLQRTGGGLAAVRIADGKLLWVADVKTADASPGRKGQAAAATAISGLVFTGAWDGVLRAVSTTDGKVVWSYDTMRTYPTINGAPGKGGSLGATGPVLAGGMLYMTSGYVGPGGGAPGNVLIAMAPE